MTVNELIDTIRTLNEWELVKYWRSLDHKFFMSIYDEWHQVSKDLRDKIQVTMTRAVQHQVGDTVVLLEDYKDEGIIPKGTIGTLIKIKKDFIFNSYDVLIGQGTITIKGFNGTALYSIAGTW